MIDVKNLEKTFGDHKVLAGINEHIYPGEKVVVIGPSGSGKSTFLRCLNLLEEPTAGTITVDGEDITDPKTDIDKVRQKMGMVFQQFNLFPHLTIKENIKLAPVTLKLMSDSEAEQKRWNFWNVSVFRIKLRHIRNSFPVVSSSELQLPAPWP